MSLHDRATSDVDAYTLLKAMSEQDRAAIRDAWWDAGPASSDGVVAAVATNRVAKQIRSLRLFGVGATVYTLLSVATLSGSLLRVTPFLVAAGAAVWAWYAFVRSRRNIARLAAIADPGTAAARARELRASTSQGTS